MGEVTESSGFSSPSSGASNGHHHGPEGSLGHHQARPHRVSQTVPPPPSASIRTDNKVPAVKEGNKTSPNSTSHLAENGTWDTSKVREEDFDQLAVYLVPDAVTDPDEPNRAEASLPRNLSLKPSGVINDVSTKKKIVT